MSTAVLNVRVGQKITYRDAAGVEHDAEVIGFPRVLLVMTQGWYAGRDSSRASGRGETTEPGTVSDAAGLAILR